MGRGKEAAGGLVRLYTSYDSRGSVVKLAEASNAKQVITESLTSLSLV